VAAAAGATKVIAALSDPFVDGEIFGESCRIGFSELYFCAEGDLSLRKDSVVFDGFHVHLQAGSGTDFAPTVDTIHRPEGLYLLVDLPGFFLGSPHAKGSVKAEGTSTIVISGSRSLALRTATGGAAAKADPIFVIYRNHPEEDESAAGDGGAAGHPSAPAIQSAQPPPAADSQLDHLERQCGTFERRVKIDTSLFTLAGWKFAFLEGGVLQIFVPRIILDDGDGEFRF
jgi:hypothetical protein